MAFIIQVLVIIFGAVVALQNIIDVLRYYIEKRKNTVGYEFMTNVSILDFVLVVLLFYQLVFKEEQVDDSWVIIMGIVLFLLCFTSVWRRIIQKSQKENRA